MAFNLKVARRAIAPVLGAGAVALALALPGTASAAPLPAGCTAANLADVTGDVAKNTATYLNAHPNVNAFYTGLHNQPTDEVKTKVTAFFKQNPQTLKDLNKIRQPLVDFRTKCNIPEPSNQFLGQ